MTWMIGWLKELMMPHIVVDDFPIRDAEEMCIIKVYKV
jgi:hypothetical protein